MIAVPALRAVISPVFLFILATFLSDEEKIGLVERLLTFNCFLEPTSILLLFLIESTGVLLGYIDTPPGLEITVGVAVFLI